jgi:1-phosphofructokinase family hexose kinase
MLYARNNPGKGNAGMTIVTVSLNPSLDKTCYFDKKVELGRTNRAKDAKLAIGGKGLNVSRVFKNLGIAVRSLGFYGGLSGRYLVEQLDRLGIGNNLIRTEAETRQNVKLIGENTQYTEFNESGGPITESELESLITELNSIKNAVGIDLLFLCGSVPKGIRLSIYKDILESFSGTDTKVIVDAEGEALAQSLKSDGIRPFLIKPNQYEFETLTGKSYDLGQDFDAAMERIRDDVKSVSREYDVRVLLTLGEYGAIFAQGDHIVETAAHKVKARGFTCAGDVFLSCFVAAYFGRIDEIPEGRLDAALSFAASGAASKMECDIGAFPEYRDFFRFCKYFNAGGH